MIEISNRVFVGNDDDYRYGWSHERNWSFVHAAKDPWHREFVGYKGRSAPKESDEYYYAIRNKEIALNIIDVENPDWFNMDMIKMAIGFTIKHHGLGYNVLIHCNHGESRSPSLGLLYLATIGEIPNETFNSAETAFIGKYKHYNPKAGIRKHLQMHWYEYMSTYE